MKLPLALSLILVLGATPAPAIEQNCRFIQARAEREACYSRQEAELAAKRKPPPSAALNTPWDCSPQANPIRHYSSLAKP